MLSLVGENGYIVLYEFVCRETMDSREGYYEFGGKKYKCSWVNDALYIDCLKSNRFIDISIKHLKDAPCLAEGDKVSFITAKKF